MAVSVTFVGVIVNNLPSTSKDSPVLSALEKNRNWGNILALFGAICYAIFLIFLQQQTIKKIGYNRPILFAFIGLFTMIFCWPVLIILSVSDQEVLELPSKLSIYFNLFLKIILGSIIPPYLWNLAFAMTSLLYIAVGTSLAIPLNFIADYF